MAEYSPLDDLVDRVMDAADEWHFDGINTTQSTSTNPRSNDD
jgi:hypothetical protein